MVTNLSTLHFKSIQWVVCFFFIFFSVYFIDSKIAQSYFNHFVDCWCSIGIPATIAVSEIHYNNKYFSIVMITIITTTKLFVCLRSLFLLCRRNCSCFYRFMWNIARKHYNIIQLFCLCQCFAHFIVLSITFYYFAVHSATTSTSTFLSFPYTTYIIAQHTYFLLTMAFFPSFRRHLVAVIIANK